MNKLNRPPYRSCKASEIISFKSGNATSGVMGFTVSYRDGTFKNILLPYNDSDYSAVKTQICQLKMQYSRSLDKDNEKKPEYSKPPKKKRIQPIRSKR